LCFNKKKARPRNVLAVLTNDC